MPSSLSPELCRKEKAADPPSLFQNGRIVIQTHHIGWIVTGCFTLIATVISFWLVNKHLQWYTNKREQRYIVRILFMVPLYAIISFASYLWWNHATPIILIRDGYESTVLTAFFYLLLLFLSCDQEDQQLIFMKRGLSRQNDAERIKNGEATQRWVFPLGFMAWKPLDGLYFLQLMKWGVLQYCVLRPLTTLSAVILDSLGLYCEASWSPRWGHIYITVIVSISVTIAMYCLIQLYVVVSKELAPHKPLLKLFAIKAVVFLTFWQATFLSVLSIFGVVKDTQYMTAEDINIGIGAMLETFEMMLFALLHIKAFTYKVYRPLFDPTSDLAPPEPTIRLKSLGHAMDFREMLRELWAGCLYMWHKFRGKEPVLDTSAIRATYYEGVFGRSRSAQHQDHDDSDNDNTDVRQPTLPQVQVQVTERVEVDIEGERQWLGTGDNYGYGLKFLQRERSEGLEQQIEKELGKRGYTIRSEDDADLQRSKHPKRKSWWRSIYNRVSQTGQDDTHQEGLSANMPIHNRAGRQSRLRRFSWSRDAAQRLLIPVEIKATELDLEDPPPPSLIARKNRHELRKTVDKWRQDVESPTGYEDAPTPLSESAGVHSDNRHTHGLGHGCVHGDERHKGRLSVPLDMLSLSVTPAVTDPRRTNPLQSPDSEGRLVRLFRSATNDPHLDLPEPPVDTARSEISSVEVYRLIKPTLPVDLVLSQATVIPTGRMGVSVEARSAQYHLADSKVLVPMTAEDQEDRDIVVSTNYPVSMHRRELAGSRIHHPDLDDPKNPPERIFTPVCQLKQPRAGPSVSDDLLSPELLITQQNAAPHYGRRSFPSNVDIPYPSSVSLPRSRRKQPHHTRQDHLFGDTPVSLALSYTRQAPSLATSPRGYGFSSLSVIDDRHISSSAHASRHS